MLSNYGVFMEEIIDKTHMVKPVVYFAGEPRFDTKLFSGHEVAHIYTEDHHVWGRGKIRTSQVLNKFSDGSFETLNTMYKPKNDS